MTPPSPVPSDASDPAPHPAAVPALVALLRLVEATTDEHDRAVLGAALDAVRAAYPVQDPPARPHRQVVRGEGGWPVLRSYRPNHGMAGDFGMHDDPHIDDSRPNA